MRILLAAVLIALPIPSGASASTAAALNPNAMAVSPAEERPTFPRAQRLVDETVARTPGLIDALLHVSPAVDAPNIVIAAHLRQANGEASGEDDLGVAATGAPLVEVQKDGRRLGVLVQLRDSRRQALGALGLMYAYTPGDDIEAVVRRSFAIRDALERRITSRASLTG